MQNQVTMDSVDRLVYVDVFRHTGVWKSKLENNPYKQGSISHLAWVEGCNYWAFEERILNENKE